MYKFNFIIYNPLTGWVRWDKHLADNYSLPPLVNMTQVVSVAHNTYEGRHEILFLYGENSYLRWRCGKDSTLTDAILQELNTIMFGSNFKKYVS